MSWPYRPTDIPYPFPGSLYDPQLARKLYGDYLTMFRRADELGIEAIFIAEHHYSRTGTGPSPNLMAAVVATHTERAKIGLLGNCLPLHAHPVRLAEELAMIDVLSNGRLVSGFLRGNSQEYEAYSVDIARARSMYEEAWELIVKAWTEPEPFAWHGANYHYDVVSILPRPLQQPHPPILATGNSAESIEWAARHHVPLMTGFSPTSQVAETFGHYRRFAQEQCGWTPIPSQMGINRHVYVAATDALAREQAEPFMYDYYHASAATPEARQRFRDLEAARNTGRSFSYKSAPHQSRPRLEVVDYDWLIGEGYCIVGSPDTVTRAMKEQGRLTGAGVIISYLPWGNMSLAQAMSSVDLLACEVLPNLAED
jgi:alkanesulfonate monooxygenase SsuD/methylene tetrahydromethanopterin reductase-like flavin-dependent oxidoreductase (luciferase family)